MMRAVLFLCVCACYMVAGLEVGGMNRMPKYDSRYDYLDIDAILDSRRLVKNYVECLINSYRCTPEGKALKRILPEALRTKCVRCTERQKKTAVKVIKRLKYEYPEEWAKLSSRWDPTGDFTRYFEEFLDKDNFNTIIGSADESPEPSPVPMCPPPVPEPASPTPSASSTEPPKDVSTPPHPVILNRFGDEGELMMSPSSATGTARPTVPLATAPTTAPPRPIHPGSGSDSMPTRFPLRPFHNINNTPGYTTAITLIDQIGYKIMRTTELVTDILRNTVRAVVGR